MIPVEIYSYRYTNTDGEEEATCMTGLYSLTTSNSRVIDQNHTTQLETNNIEPVKQQVSTNIQRTIAIASCLRVSSTLLYTFL